MPPAGCWSGFGTPSAALATARRPVAKVGFAALAAGLAAVVVAFKQGLADAADFETIMARIRAAGVGSAVELRKALIPSSSGQGFKAAPCRHDLGL